MDVGGTLVEVPVQPGQRVQAGETLARIDPAPLQDKVAAAQAGLAGAQAQLAQLQECPTEAEMAGAQLAVAQAQGNLDDLQAGATAAQVAAAQADVAAAQKDLAALQARPDPDGLVQARAELDRTRAALQQAQAAYDRVRSRADVAMTQQALDLQNATIAHQAAQAGFEAAKRPATPDELRAAQAALAQLRDGPSDDDLQLAELQKTKAEADLAQLQAGPSDADLKQAQSAVQSAELALSQAQTDLAAATLTAPFDGIVLEVNAQPGERVAAGASLVVLSDPTALEIQSSVVEEDLPLVRAGQPVELFFDARPDAVGEGSVVTAWGQKTGDRLVADVLVYTAPPVIER
jgi:HlyD family secretion protein